MINNCTSLARRIFVVFWAFILAGCAGKSVNEPAPKLMEQSSPYAGCQDALGILLNNAFKAMESGSFDEASGWLSRAMRISPTEPTIYFHMAEIRKEQGNPDQARELVGRAMSLGPEPALIQRLKTLMQSLES